MYDQYISFKPSFSQIAYYRGCSAADPNAHQNLAGFTQSAIICRIQKRLRHVEFFTLQRGPFLASVDQ